MNNPLSDFQISFQHIDATVPRINKGIQIIFVLSGKIKIETSDRFYHMEENDLLVINRNQLYQVQGDEENRIMVLSISDGFMEHHYENYRNHRFECYSREVDLGREEKILAIRKLLANVMISYYRQDESYQIELTSYICQLLLILIRSFKAEGSIIQKIDTGDRRLLQIIDYMERNYDQMITLEEIASKYFLSTSYLSRYFKQNMGIGFSRYLMNIRLKHGMKELLYTDDSISQIAMNNGFPNTKAFSTLFKEVHGVTPHVYRDTHNVQKEDSVQTYSKEDVSHLIQSSEIIERLSNMNVDDQKSYNLTELRYEKLPIALSDLAKVNLHYPDHILIVGEISELLKEDVRSQIIEVKKDLQLRFIGVRHPSSSTGIPPEVETDEEIPTTSPYFNIDNALEFMRNHDLSLFIRIDYIDISRDGEQYFTKLVQFIRHCLQRYGESFVKQWHVLFYEPYPTVVDAIELKRTYIKLHEILKTMIPSIQVGVYMPFSFIKEKTSTHHEWQLEHGELIDFIGYNANQNEVIDFEETAEKEFELAKDYIKEKTNKLKLYLKRNHLEKPLHLVAWNTLSGNTRYTNGTFFRGALVLQNILDISRDVTTIALWINTITHEQSGRDLRYRMDGVELFHYLKGKRPAYFALMFLKRLQGEIVAQDQNYVMTKNDRGYQLIIMNTTIINPYLSTEEAFLQRLHKEVHVTVSGIPKGDYQIRKQVFDKNNGALYTKWRNLNSKYGMDAEIIDYIIHSSRPSLEIFDESIEDEWSFYSNLTSNAIHFFDIRKAY
ncbi:helix-turn-helix domain-containing protein [Sporosarcina thermotolerans]|uniref:Helix-turn-helix domain-containing protein n=1 Tax=Sporosarcina thermotolerans TaxID=633404 RepID=A0AAW9A5V7_9BACL|nr:helix-turn-helix domain-containing protein [Sporosarcina thermotolerans]MDW0116467.1 helix-turn-helix domain-containing protein [Sporosarcina thermotolerans]WHT48409.1 helix-turn-helix domain-containing protein [Sporosarcina thermotolerans]